MLLMVWEGLLKRHLLTNPKEPLVLSLQAMIFINNAVGFCAAMVLVLSYELWLFGYKAIPHIRVSEVTYTICAAFLTSLYHYMGLQLAKAVSASYVLCTTFLSKVAIVVFATLCLGDTTRPTCLFALSLALGGNLLYLLSRLNVMHSQELSTQAIKEDGTNINDNVREKPEKPEPSSAEPSWWQAGLDRLAGKPAVDADGFIEASTKREV